MKILVIEDDRTVGQYVKRGLEEQRYQADLVDDVERGVKARGSQSAFSSERMCCAAPSTRSCVPRWSS